MSTQLSGDMVWEKSSTRRYAPPGGQTSISLGDYVKPSPPAAAANGSGASAAASPPRPASNGAAKTTVTTPAKPAPAMSCAGMKVGIAVCEASDLKNATVAALQRLGAKTTVYEVSDPLQLPYAAQCMINNAGVVAVVAMGFLVSDAHWCSKEVAGALVKTLLDMSLSLKVPVVNGLCFSLVTESELGPLSAKLARGLINTAALGEAGSNSFEVSRKHTVPSSPFASTARSLSLGPNKKSSVFDEPRAVPSDLGSMLLGLKTSLKAHGARGIFGLARHFRTMDSDESGSVSFHEFQVCMRDMHMGWTEDELKNVFEHFDTDGSNTINYDEFLFAVRGDINERRGQVILEAFDALDKDKSGAINTADVKSSFDASKHPGVLNKRRTEEEVMEEFLQTFEGEVKDGKVTPEEWCRYYAMLSASMTSDDEFELMVRNAWHLPAGKSGFGNTSARRVLATRADGTKTVEEVKGAAGMGNANKKAILQSLRSQGLNVTCVSLFGTLDTTEPPDTSEPAAASETMSVGAPSVEGSTYAPPVRQGPGGNSSLVLG